MAVGEGIDFGLAGAPCLEQHKEPPRRTRGRFAREAGPRPSGNIDRRTRGEPTRAAAKRTARLGGALIARLRPAASRSAAVDLFIRLAARLANQPAASSTEISGAPARARATPRRRPSPPGRSDHDRDPHGGYAAVVAASPPGCRRTSSKAGELERARRGRPASRREGRQAARRAVRRSRVSPTKPIQPPPSPRRRFGRKEPRKERSGRQAETCAPPERDAPGIGIIPDILRRAARSRLTPGSKVGGGRRRDQAAPAARGEKKRLARGRGCCLIRDIGTLMP